MFCGGDAGRTDSSASTTTLYSTIVTFLNATDFDESTLRTAVRVLSSGENFVEWWRSTVAFAWVVMRFSLIVLFALLLAWVSTGAFLLTQSAKPCAGTIRVAASQPSTDAARNFEVLATGRGKGPPRFVLKPNYSVAEYELGSFLIVDTYSDYHGHPGPPIVLRSRSAMDVATIPL